MREFSWLLVAPALLVSCAHTKTDDEASIEEGAQMGKADTSFYREIRGAKRKCKADVDCPEGALCHPGTHSCFAGYPLPRMVDVTLQQSRSGQERPCILVRVYFPSSSVELVEEARRWLEYDARCLSVVPRKRVILTAHSDALGAAGANLKLSRKRGEAVKAFLQEKGVQTPIEVIGRGEEDPLMTGSSERDYAFNRRVEILVENADTE